MAFLPTKKRTDVNRVLLEHREEIQDLTQALINGQKDVGHRLEQLLGDVPKHIRDGIIKKMREHAQEHNAHKTRELDLIFHEHELLRQERFQIRKQRTWLAYVLPQDAMRKIRESLARSPMLNKQLAEIGHDLADKGVTVSLQHGNHELGELSAIVQHQQKRGTDQERGI